MNFWKLLLLAFVLSFSGCGKPFTNPSNQNQIVVRKTNELLAGKKAVRTLIYTPYLREEIRRSEDGALNFRFLTATIHDNADERLSQTVIFEGTTIREVSLARYNKRTKALNEAKYAPDGTFIMQRTNRDAWSDQDGKPISRTELINVLEMQKNKSIDLSKSEVQLNK